MSFEKYDEAIDKLQKALQSADADVEAKNRRLTQLSSSIGNLETQVTMQETERKRLNSEVEHWKDLASKTGGVSSPDMMEKLEKIQKEHREEMNSLRLEMENQKRDQAKALEEQRTTLTQNTKQWSSH